MYDFLSTNAAQGRGLLQTPEDIIRWRERFFKMEEPFELTNEERNDIWPLVDNFYMRCGGSGLHKQPQWSGVHYFACRFSRAQGTPQGTGNRTRKLREVSERCGMRIKVSFWYSRPPDVNGEGGIFDRWRFERMKTCSAVHGADCSIEALDSHKLNSAVRRTAGEAALGGLSAAEVVRIMRSKNLNAAGGKTLTVTMVHNNSRIWKNGPVPKNVNRRGPGSRYGPVRGPEGSATGTPDIAPGQQSDASLTHNHGPQHNDAQYNGPQHDAPQHNGPEHDAPLQHGVAHQYGAVSQYPMPPQHDTVSPYPMPPPQHIAPHHEISHQHDTGPQHHMVETERSDSSTSNGVPVLEV